MVYKQSEINDKILLFLRSNPEGILQDRLTSLIPFKEEEIVNGLNELIQQNRIIIIDTPGGVLFKFRSEKEALKFRDLSQEEKDVYEIVISSGSNGIGTNEIKSKVRIDNTTFINKILNKLSKKFLIRGLKVLNTKNKKVWIGYDVEPSQEITGGIWCVNQEYDKSLISVFSEKIYDRICSQNSVSRKELLLYVKSINLTQGNLDVKEDDIQKILNVLIFDRKIEPIFPENINAKFFDNKYALLLSKNDQSLDYVKYRKTKQYKSKTLFDAIPCGLCPMLSECKEENLVNSKECPHLNKFLDDINL